MHDQKLARLFDRYRTKNDLAALAEVFDAVSPELLRVARHVAGRTSDPEDLVQGTFLAAIEHASTYDVERPLVPWLLGILINQSRSARRRAIAHLPEEAAAAITSGTRPIDDAEANEIDAAVRSALSQLPDTYRDVLVPHLSEGKKPHQIARDLGRPQGTVRAQIHRGIRLMRRTLPAGFSLGLLGVLSSSALADVRTRVLTEGARATGLPVGEALRIQAQAATRLLRRRVAAASLAVGVGVATWLAWPTHGDARAVVAASEPAVESTHALASTEGAGAGRSRAGGGEAAAAEDAPRAVASDAVGSVLVHVTDADGVVPVEGAAVQLIAWGDPLWFEGTRTLRTGADGIASFERVHSGRIGVHVDGGAQLRADVLARRETRVDARRERGLSLDVRVVDRDGRPVRGAVVDVYSARDRAPTSTSPRTDVDGRVRLDDVSPSALAAARAEGHVNSNLMWLESPRLSPAGAWATGNDNAVAGPARIELRLNGSATTFDGRVLDSNGRPVAGASVLATAATAVRPSWSAEGDAVFERAPSSATSDAAGRFRLEGLDDATVLLRIEATGLAVTEASLVARDGRFEAADFVLHGEAQVRGVARYRAGEPAAFAVVTAEVVDDATAGSSERSSVGDAIAPSAPRPGRARVTTTAGADGSFLLTGVPTGRVELSARAGGIGPVASATRLVRSGAAEEWQPIVEHVATIEGQAFGQDGRLVKTWLVLAVPEAPAGRSAFGEDGWLREHLIPDPSDMSLQCWIDLNGRFVVPCVGAGPHRLELRPRDAWQGVVQAVRAHVEPGSRGVELRVQRARGVVHGRVVDSDGAHVDVAAVTAVSADVAGTVRGVVDATDGHFQLELPSGRHEILVWPSDGAPQHLATVVLKADERVDLPDLALQPTGSLRIESADGELRGLEVRRERGLAFAPRVEDTSRGQRAWIVRGLQPGRHVVTWSDAAGRRSEREVDVGPGEAARLAISQP